MKLIGRNRRGRVYKTFHGRFRIFTWDKSLLKNGQSGKYLVLYNNPFDEGCFINRFFQWYLLTFRGYQLERWGFYSTRTLVKKIK